MDYKEIKVEIRSRLAIVTFDRPKKKNAITHVMYKELTEVLNKLSEDENTVITALTGSGEYYCSGTNLDLSNFAPSENFLSTMSDTIRNFVNAFIDHRKILIAVVNGPAIGIAVSTLGLCDVVHCSDSATFLTPFSKLGLSVEGCSSYTFPRIMGPAMASEMLLFNRKLTASEALNVGLVAAVHTKDEIQTKLWPKLEQYSKELPSGSLIYSKQIMRRYDINALHEANNVECKRLEERWTSDDFMTAVFKFANRSKA